MNRRKKNKKGFVAHTQIFHFYFVHRIVRNENQCLFTIHCDYFRRTHYPAELRDECKRE